MLNSTIWGSKRVFIISRLVSVGVGMLRLFALIRILPVEEFAVIGIVESFRAIFAAIFAFGVAASLSREAMVEKCETRKGAMVLATYFSDALFWFLSMGSMLIAILILGEPYIQYLNFYLLVALMGLFDRFWSTSLVVLRINEQMGAFVIFGVLYAIANFIVVVIISQLYGITGYFVANTGTLAIFSISCIFMSSRKITPPNLSIALRESKAAFSTLWGISWFTYVGKSSTQIWRRLPLVIAANYLNESMIGVVTITMELAAKVQILNDALRPLIVPRLSAIKCNTANNIALFFKTARREAIHLIGINSIATLGVVIVWYFFGDILLGIERYSQVEWVFYLAVLTELTLVIISTINICIIVPMKCVDGILGPVVIVRILVVPILYMCFLLGAKNEMAVFLSLLSTGIMVSLVYLYKTKKFFMRLVA